MLDTILVKRQVCDQCYSSGITDTNCICSYGKYKIIELEFEACKCCGSLVSDGSPADTKFNENQLNKLVQPPLI